MEVYLIQHGEAKGEAEDPARPLTDRGREEVRRVAAAAARARLSPAKIWHSGKLRAEQTALIFAEALGLEDKVISVTGLAPNDDVRPTAELLELEVEPIMMVGHLPFMSRLASFLLIGNADKPVVRFRMGGIVCLARRDDPKGWEVAWAVTPELVSFWPLGRDVP